MRATTPEIQGSEFLARRGGHGDLRKTLSSRPVMSLSSSSRPGTALRLSRRPTRSVGGAQFKCACHPSKPGAGDGLLMQLGGVEEVLVSKRVSGRADAVLSVAHLEARACRTAVGPVSLSKVYEKVSGGALSEEVTIVWADSGLRRRRSLCAEGCCEVDGSGVASSGWERAGRGRSFVPVMVTGELKLRKRCKGFLECLIPKPPSKRRTFFTTRIVSLGSHVGVTCSNNEHGVHILIIF
jgi:hypothetical protein